MEWLTTFLLTFGAFCVLFNSCKGLEDEDIQDYFGKNSFPKEPTKEVLPNWAKKYTRKSHGCPCWWDLTRKEYDCACCQNRGIQCGYPLHRFCQRDTRKNRNRKGCPGNYYC